MLLTSLKLFVISRNKHRAKLTDGERENFASDVISRATTELAIQTRLLWTWTASEKHPESKNEITELRKLIKDLQKKEAKASEELQSFKLAKERSVNSFFAVMRPRLRRQNEGRYVNRFSSDKDLILLKKILNNKIPIDTSRDCEMPFLIERYRRGLPNVDRMWIVTHNCLLLHGTN